jgi:hypothetical protein
MHDDKNVCKGVKEKKIMHERKNIEMNKWIDNERQLFADEGIVKLSSDMMQKLIINGMRRAKFFIA